ncbi:MAG: SCO family protein, partial [Candidatus Latescibacterota bacterium]
LARLVTEPRRSTIPRRLAAAAWLALVAWLGIPAELVAQPPDADRLGRIGIDQHLGERLPLNLVFRDETGREVTLGSFFGDRPVILSLVYYECPMLCTQVLNGLVRGLRPLSFEPGREFELVTVSIDPGESPELAAAKKREYVTGYGRAGAATSWHFLTGGQAEITALAEAVGFRYEYDPPTDQFIHASGIMVTTPDGRLSRYFYGIDYAPRDLRLGLVESAEGRIGSPVDKLLLLCYRYDPMTGRYGFLVVTSLRLAAVATVAFLAGLVLLLLRRERRTGVLKR